MAFISELMHYRDDVAQLWVPESVEVCIRAENLDRLSDYQLATYRADGSQADVLDLLGTAPVAELGATWFRFKVSFLEEDDPVAAVALTDFSLDEPVLSFLAATDCDFPAISGLAKGATARPIGGPYGAPIQFDPEGRRLDRDKTNTSLGCISAGTMIDTPSGPKRIEDLIIGDLVTTYNNGDQPIRLIHSVELPRETYYENRLLWPVCIQPGALGFGVPQRNLLVSQQQRMLYQSSRIPDAFAQDAVFVRAKSLAAGFEEIYIDSSLEAITYFHLVFDKHEIIFAEGAPTESFLPGPDSIGNLDKTARKALFDLFPDLRFGHDLHNADYQTVRSWELKAAVP